MNRDLAWRLLLADLGSHELATVVLGELEQQGLIGGLDADRRGAATLFSIVDGLGSDRLQWAPGEVELLNPVATRHDPPFPLASLRSRDRRAVVCDALFGPSMPGQITREVAIVALQFETTPDVIVGHVRGWLAEQHVPVPVATGGSTLAVVAALVAVAAGVWMVASVGAGDNAAPTSASTTTVAASTSVVPSETSAVVVDPQRFVEPDRVVDLEVEVDDDGRSRVIRKDAETGELLWTSPSFEDAIVRAVDGDTVTIDASGRTLYLSVRDGTLLPP